MPETGFDPFGGFTPGAPIDMSGPGTDPSYAWALAPGGRFPGDEYFWREYQAALANGTAGGDPNYDPNRAQEWLSGRHSLLGMLMRGHIANQAGGPGQAPTLPGGYPWQGASGPGAAYGPGGNSPTRGLFDLGRPPDTAWDSPEHRPPGEIEVNSPAKKKGNGGGKGHYTFTPVNGIQHQSQFVDWQPITPGTTSTEATRFIPGLGSSTPIQTQASAPAAAGRGKQPRAGRAGAGGGDGGSRTGAGAGTKPIAGARPGGGGTPVPLGQVPGSGDGSVPRGAQINLGTTMRENIFGGVDTNNLDHRTPGWLRDPTTGIMNTSGFPNATPFAPTSGGYRTSMGQLIPGQNFDDYATALHDAGYNSEDILSLLGPYGYRQDDQGNWQWGWGTGPVMRDPVTGAYGFARDFSGRQLGASGPGSSEGRSGGGARGATDLASAADWYHSPYM